MTTQATYYIIRALVALVAIPFHEAGHALAAWLLGDATAKREGRLSLNPFAHFDLLGTLCMVFAGVGWAKPVSTNPRNFKNPKWDMALTALAGPVANLVLAYLGMVAWKVMYYWAPVNNAAIYIAMFLRYLVASLMPEIHGEDVQNVALGIDARSGRSLDELEVVLDRMEKAGYQFEILFLDAEDSVLVKRYKETRRSHPLAMGGRVDDGIRLEREKMRFLKERADYIIDTSHLLTRELKQEIERIFVENQEFCNMMISVLSFGFKYGIPSDADLVFDVRFLPNPYYVDELRPLTGLDERVFNYVMDCDIAREFADKLEDMIEFLIPNYVKEGKTNLVIAIGCTGGKHRSVTLARELYSRLSKNKKYGFRLEHRDVDKDRLLKKQEG